MNALLGLIFWGLFCLFENARFNAATADIKSITSKLTKL
ncbi:hypothetical protein RGAI101_3958 [Roseobacter sp. GAI101]|nr:hypothetical protein RGAI101_3958 [Roseobacter sp. GAI101]